MLVLSRRVGERLVIGDDIVVTVIEVRSDGVRLGIDAPRSVAVHRAEVLEAVTAANVAAAEAGGTAGDEAAESLRTLLAPGATPLADTPGPAAPGASAGPDRSARTSLSATSASPAADGTTAGPSTAGPGTAAPGTTGSRATDRRSTSRPPRPPRTARD